MKKVLIPAAIIGAMAISSATAFAAVNVTAGDNVQASSASIVSTTVQNDSKAIIEYTKKTLLNPDGSIAAVDETWADPVTHNKRLDYKEPVKGADSFHRVGGGYLLDNGKRYIKVGTDTDGNLVGGEIMLTDAGNVGLVAEKQEYIKEYQEGTRRPGWTDEGLVRTADGKELKKLSRTDKSEAFNTTYMESVFLNESGLPVQGEIYEEKNGKTDLLYTYFYEYKNVSDDGSLFDTNGIDIEHVR
ncbi:hypothetical protein [Paenibacillus hamazuiensis]|uniref:hypothetical protein n=1 Tax=Paenibacillus hamazuiensis TaxID=2936508 RepID=UPI00200DC625|nr:hypothetical protein [Paenibacillus hamazuiensis]